MSRSRRSVLGSIAGLGGAALSRVETGVAAAGSAATGASYWPAFARTAANDVVAADRSGPRPPFRKTWTYDAANDADGSAHPPVVADGRVFFGDGGQHVYAVDLADGSLRWKVNLDVGLRNSPVVAADGRVCVVTADGRISALDPGTGEKTYVASTERDPYGPAEVTSSPAVRDGTLVVQQGDTVQAVDLDSGEHRWRVGGVDPVPQSVVFAVADGHVVIPKSQGALVAVDLATGEEAWRLGPGYADGTFFENPVAAGGTVYLTSHRTGFSDHPDRSVVHAIDLATGERRWEHGYDTDVVSSPYPIVTADLVHFGDATYRRDGTELSPLTGAIATPPSRYRPFDGELEYTLSKVPNAATTLQGSRYDDGWTTAFHVDLSRFDAPAASVPVLVDGALLYAASGGRVVRLDGTDPQETTTGVGHGTSGRATSTGSGPVGPGETTGRPATTTGGTEGRGTSGPRGDTTDGPGDGTATDDGVTTDDAPNGSGGLLAIPSGAGGGWLPLGLLAVLAVPLYWLLRDRDGGSGAQ